MTLHECVVLLIAGVSTIIVIEIDPLDKTNSESVLKLLKIAVCDEIEQARLECSQLIKVGALDGKEILKLIFQGVKESADPVALGNL